MLDDFVETIFHKPCQTSIPITYVRRCKTKKICHNKCEKNGRKYVTLFHVAKHCNIFHFFIRMFVTRCDHTMHFFVCFFLLLCVCICSRWHIGYTKKDHVHKTNKNRELGFWFKPLKFKHFLQHINCEDPDPSGPVGRVTNPPHLAAQMCFTALFTAEFALRLYACDSVAERLGWKMELEQPMDHLVSGRLMR